MHKLNFFGKLKSFKFSLKFKLLSAFIGVASLLLITGIANFLSAQKVQSAYVFIIDKNFVQERSILHMQQAAREQIRHLSKLSIPQGSSDKYDDVFKQIDEQRSVYSKNEKNLEAVLSTEDQKTAFEQLSKTWKALNSSIDELISLFKKNAGNADRAKLVQIYYADLEETVTTMFNFSQKMEEVIRQSSHEAENKALEAAKNGTLFNQISVVIGFALALILGIWLSTYLAKNLTQVAEELNDQAQSMIEISDTLVAGGEDIRNRTQQQLDSIEKTMRTASDINTMVAQNAHNAETSTVKSRESQTAFVSVREGMSNLNQAILQMSDSTQHIAQHMQMSSQQMSEVVKLIREISSKTQVINNIVFQTKILSFNASVEAARAGEFGKGFSVVAEEIGQLARSSGQAAEEIGKMVQRSVVTVESMVKETQNKVSDIIRMSEKNASEGRNFSNQVTDLFKSVEISMSEVLSCMGEISSATSEEAQGLNQIKKSFTQVESLATENASVAQSFESQAVVLKNQSASVISVVNKLQEIVKSSNRAA